MSAVAQTLTVNEARRRAREMRAGGWGYTEIQRYLERHGVKRHWSTIRAWCDDEWRERRQTQVRAYQRDWWREQKDTGLHRVIAWDTYTIDRALEALRAEGMSHNAISKAMKVLADVQLDNREVRRRLNARGIT